MELDKLKNKTYNLETTATTTATLYLCSYGVTIMYKLLYSKVNINNSQVRITATKRYVANANRVKQLWSDRDVRILLFDLQMKDERAGDN